MTRGQAAAIEKAEALAAQLVVAAGRPDHPLVLEARVLADKVRAAYQR